MKEKLKSDNKIRFQKWHTFKFRLHFVLKSIKIGSEYNGSSEKRVDGNFFEICPKKKR